MLTTLIRGLVFLLAASLVAVTLLPLWDTTAWWVRFWDFPRVQIAALIAGVLVLLVLLRGGGWAFGIVVLAACLGYQLWRISPYTPVVRPEMRLAAPAEVPDAFTLLSANVLMENRDFAAMAALIADVAPDVLLLMETDAAWIDALAPVLADYPTVVRAPRDDHYGMVFATRLEAAHARTVRLTATETPSLFAELDGPDGQAFRFIGLHPQPPVPGQGTETRNAQILYAARFARDARMPLIAMGDFNDVAWSDTAQRFKRVGRYLDPRIGRGIYASFDATSPVMRFPLDQIYVTPDVAMVDFRRGPDVGSDHFPIIARVSLDAALAGRLNETPPEMSLEDRRETDALIAAHRSNLEQVLPETPEQAIEEPPAPAQDAPAGQTQDGQAGSDRN